MRVIKRANLPTSLNLNGKTYKRGTKTTNSVIVEVLRGKMKKVEDLRGKPYQPRVHYFNPSSHE
jgi:hypothetical protein